MITSLVQLLCRTTKLCWFDDDHFRSIVEDAKAFLAKGSSGGSPVRPPRLLDAGCNRCVVTVASIHQRFCNRSEALACKLVHAAPAIGSSAGADGKGLGRDAGHGSMWHDREVVDKTEADRVRAGGALPTVPAHWRVRWV